MTCVPRSNHNFYPFQARTIEKAESLVSSEATPPFDLSRLEHARIDGPGVALAYMGDDKHHVGISSRQILVSSPDDSHPLTESTNRISPSVRAPRSDGQCHSGIYIRYYVLLT